MGIRTGSTYQAAQARPAAAAPARGRRRNVNFYVDGNTVRVLEENPEPVAESPQRTPYRSQLRNRRLHKEAARTRSVSISLPLTILLVAALAGVCFTGYRYLGLKSSLDIHMETVKTLEATLEDMKNENDALERSIDTEVDLNHVYDVAVNQLGMVRASQANTITYDKTESEYVRQYDDIPAAER